MMFLLYFIFKLQWATYCKYSLRKVNITVFDINYKTLVAFKPNKPLANPTSQKTGGLDGQCHSEDCLCTIRTPSTNCQAEMWHCVSNAFGLRQCSSVCHSLSLLLGSHSIAPLLLFHSLDLFLFHFLNFTVGYINQRGDPNGESELIINQ